MRYTTDREYEETCLQFQSAGNKLQWIVSITAEIWYKIDSRWL